MRGCRCEEADRPRGCVLCACDVGGSSPEQFPDAGNLARKAIGGTAEMRPSRGAGASAQRQHIQTASLALARNLSSSSSMLYDKAIRRMLL